MLWGGSGGWGCLLDTHLSVLASDSLLLADSVLGSSGGLLVLELLLTDDFGLDLVDGLDEDVLVLELVTLSAEVELMVDLSVDLLSFTISLEESTEDTGSSHPEDLGWHTSILGTSSATLSVVAALSLGHCPCLGAGAGVSSHLSSHDQSVLHELSNIL